MVPGFTPEEREAAGMLWDPTADQLAFEVAAYQGTWSQQNEHRWAMAAYAETEFFLTFWLWKSAGLMLVGMALYKWGVLSAERDGRFYRRLALAGFGIGLPLVAAGAVLIVALQWDFQASFFTGLFNYYGSLLVALGYIAVVMLAAKSQVLVRLQRGLSNVGRTALSNYILQTLVCTTIFYGHGFGLFGEVSRLGQVGIMLAVWTGQVALSTLWMKHYAIGPLEWAWRSLTYLRPQPLRIPAAAR
jgi:uncharacterized protein